MASGSVPPSFFLLLGLHLEIGPAAQQERASQMSALRTYSCPQRESIVDEVL